MVLFLELCRIVLHCLLLCVGYFSFRANIEWRTNADIHSLDLGSVRVVSPSFWSYFKSLVVLNKVYPVHFGNQRECKWLIKYFSFINIYRRNLNLPVDSYSFCMRAEIFDESSIIFSSQDSLELGTTFLLSHCWHELFWIRNIARATTEVRCTVWASRTQWKDLLSTCIWFQSSFTHRSTSRNKILFRMHLNFGAAQAPWSFKAIQNDLLGWDFLYSHVSFCRHHYCMSHMAAWSSWWSCHWVHCKFKFDASNRRAFG